jgi:hypothetical protein
MKQKLIYTVLLIIAMYLPASSKECAKVFKQAAAGNTLPVKQKASVETGEITALPASPFSRLLFNL